MRHLREMARLVGWTTALGLALAQTARAEHAAPVDIPFALEGGNIVLQVELTPAHPLPFAFDSGLSGGNVISVEVAKALHLQPNANMDIQDANGARKFGKLVAIPSMTVGPTKLSNQLFAIVPIPANITQRPDKGAPPLAGFLGTSLMRDAVLCIDYAHHKLHRWKAGDFDATHYSSIPMTLTQGRPTIHVNIDGREANLIVDSGDNGALTVYIAFAAKNNFEQRYPNVSQEGEASGGGSSDALVTEAGAAKIGSAVEFRHVPLMIIHQGVDPASGIDGMVGFLLLSRLDPCLDGNGKRFFIPLGGPGLPSASAFPSPPRDARGPGDRRLAVAP